ncbi:HDIG domain protein [uncultured delta proteobacterium]|uniref:HDIG domain protein n=1 Tax=uncultured delta proteobacterium TaxID=34034 RepID=A0A212JM77_9DELT|nr:HDIG domain protein [uncultured delta proteobacterium]
MLTRDAALALLNEQNPEQHMVQHALASEAVMRALARHFGEDEELWGLAGLLHDVDFPHTRETPEKHGLVAEGLLTGKLPPEVVTAVKAHNGECTGALPETRLDYALRAGETVTGMVMAAALVRPTGMDGMEAKSLKKKMKDKTFAAAVSRERIRECEKIDLSLDDFFALAIKAMS